MNRVLMTVRKEIFKNQIYVYLSLSLVNFDLLNSLLGFLLLFIR